MDGVEVYVVTSGRSARTDSSGRYVFAGMIEGRTRLRARQLGSSPAETTFVLAPHSNVTANFALSRAQALDTIRVLASQDDCAPRAFNGFNCRRKAAIGVFRDSVEIAALRPEYLADMFDGIAGLRRDGRGVASTTVWHCLKFLFNGRPPMPLDRYDPKGVVAFEFYPDPAKIPSWYKNFAYGQFSRHSPEVPCAMIVLWTKGSQ